MAHKNYNIIIEQGIDGYLISTVLELPGCHTQALSYDELISRTREAIELYVAENKYSKSSSKFIGLQQLTV